MKSISTINPAITEKTKCLILKLYTPAIHIKVVCGFNKVYYYALFRFQLFGQLANIPSKE